MSKEDEGTTSSNPSARQRSQSRSGRNSFFILPLTTPYMPRLGSSFDRGSMASPSTAPTAASSALRTAAAALGRPRKTVTALATTRPFATPDQHGSGAVSDTTATGSVEQRCRHRALGQHIRSLGHAAVSEPGAGSRRRAALVRAQLAVHPRAVLPA